MNELRKLPTPPATEVAIADLATELGTAVPRLWMLIEHGYLRLAAKTDSCFTTTVERPGDSAFQWLRGMLAPLVNRPYLPLRFAAELYGITMQETRKLCLTHNIVFQLDPVFGEVITLRDYAAIGPSVYRMQNPMSFERQPLFEVFAALLDRVHFKKPYVPRAPRIHEEIRRIAAMKEPDRTIRGTEFWIAYRDARTVADAIRREKTGATIEKLDRAALRMEQALLHKLPWDKVPMKEPKVKPKLKRRTSRGRAFRPRPAGSFVRFPLRAAASDPFAVPSPSPTDCGAGPSTP